jgi:ribose transport system permease protein
MSGGIVGQLAALAIVFAIFTLGTGGSYLSLRNLLTILGLAGIPMIVCLGIHLTIVIGAMDLSTAMTGGAGGVVNTLIGALIMGVIQNGLTVIGVDVYGQQVFLGILVIIAVAITFDRAKVAIIK